MWTTILSTLLPLALKILNAYFEKNKEAKDQREAYLKFLESMQASATTPARMKESYEDQMRRLRGEVIENPRPTTPPPTSREPHD